MIFRRYASYYDVFYKAKNYRKECRFLEQLFRRHLRRKPKTILDLGCGTGNHSLVLAKRGFRVTGIDASRSMLRIAWEKCRRQNLSVKFHQKKLHFVDLKKKFDAVICMFSVIDYLTKDSELKRAFSHIARHMKKDALFIFDFWNEEAVNKFFTPAKKKIYRFGNQYIERSSHTKIFPSRKVCQVDYTCTVKGGKNTLHRFQERHVVRYFSLEEIKRFLNEAGLEFKEALPLCRMNGKIRRNTWDIACVCQKV